MLLVDFEPNEETELTDIPFNEDGKLYEVIEVRDEHDFIEEFSQGFYAEKALAVMAAPLEQKYADSPIEIREYTADCWNAKEHCFDSWDIVEWED